MFASIFNTFVIEPIFNLLVFIYALLPGHNFGLAIILFTIVVRTLMWPLVKKQLHHTKAMRALQPDLKRIKKAAKGDRQKESMMMMELYKEREISPFGPIGILVVQFIILIGLYRGLSKVVVEPKHIIDMAYPFMQNLSWMKQLASDISKFDASLLSIIDLKRAAWGTQGFYFPAFILVAGSAIIQYYSSKQLMPKNEDSRTLRQILKDAGKGREAEQSEVSTAVGQTTKYFIPVMIFVFTIGLASALSLYWLVSGLVAYWQQSRILGQDEDELEAIADKESKATEREKNAVEAEIVETKEKPAQPTPKNKRRKR